MSRTRNYNLTQPFKLFCQHCWDAKHGTSKQSIYLAWPLLPGDLCSWPDTAPHRIKPRSWPLPPTTCSRNSTSQRRNLKGHVNDRGHRTCNTKHVVKSGRKWSFIYMQQILTTLGKRKGLACISHHSSNKMLLCLQDFCKNWAANSFYDALQSKKWVHLQNKLKSI